MGAEILTEAGFTKGEIRVYLALLDLGESTTGPIIDKSGISSSKVYEILDKLKQKGLVSYVIKDKTKYFQPASPGKIKDYINEKKRKFFETEKKVDKLIPTLEKKQKLSEEIQTTSVYEGFEGIKAVFSRILGELDKDEEYYVTTLDEEVNSEELRLFFLNYHAKRVEKGIRVKLLSPIKLKKKILSKYPKYKLSERRFAKEAFPAGLFILKDMVIHFIYRPKPTLFIIKSQGNYESYKKFFLEIWNRSI